MKFSIMIIFVFNFKNSSGHFKWSQIIEIHICLQEKKKIIFNLQLIKQSIVATMLVVAENLRGYADCVDLD